MKEKREIYTIGHSTRTMDEFLKLLENFNIKRIVDVRTIPKSKHNPQFNKENLEKDLKKVGIKYQHIKELGGLRHSKKDSKNLGWRNLSFRGFADYIQTDEFEKGILILLKKAKKETIAIMCAEAVPWRCHRSLIADYLTKRKWKVFHITSLKSAKKHKLTPFLKTRKGKIIYP